MSRLPDGRFQFDDVDPLPPVAMSFTSTAWNPTGAWRSREPVFRDARPPCADVCPVGQDIVDQLRLVAEDRILEAGEVILATNPFPASTGRVCPHPCTRSCNRSHLEGSVDIPGIERAIGDALLQAKYLPRFAPTNGKRIAVVGAGPAGLTAAHYLARGGFAVTVFDREQKPGGLLWSGIPPYRLPRAIADAEVARALQGVEFAGGRSLGSDLSLEALRSDYDAVLLTIGRHAARRLGIPGDGAAGVVDGLELLLHLHRGQSIPEGKQVLVIGGGNTALDCARSLLRRGREVQIAYRRDRQSMPAFADELEEAMEEGVPIHEWTLPLEVLAADGHATGVKFVKARPGALDPTGRPRPEPIPGTDFVLPADLIIAAAGEELDRRALPPELLGQSHVRVREDYSTWGPKTWAAGDCAGTGGTVAEAIGQGRRAAAAIAEVLGGPGPLVDPMVARGAGTEVTSWERIRPQYYPRSFPRPRHRSDLGERRGDAEVRAGFDGVSACEEAKRCLSCGTCTGCDNCHSLCSDKAVVRRAPGHYEVDVTRCKGCGVCVEECPRGAVTLRELGGKDVY